MRWTPDRAGGPGSSPGRGTALCSWARYFTLIVPLSTQVYKWVPVNLLLGVTLRWTSIPFEGGVAILLVASCYGNPDKLRPGGPLGSYADFTLLLNAVCHAHSLLRSSPPIFKAKENIVMRCLEIMQAFGRWFLLFFLTLIPSKLFTLNVLCEVSIQ